MCEEIWRDIPSYPDYQASNLGRIRSKDRVITVDGKDYPHTGKILSPAKNDKYGHLFVVLYGKPVSVHKLVMLAFVGERPNGMDIRHLDSNPMNNNIDNLCYGTRTENNIDMVKMGRCCKQKLSFEQVFEIRKLLKEGISCNKISKMYGVSHQTISNILNRKTFYWLEEEA